MMIMMMMAMMMMMKKMKTMMTMAAVDRFARHVFHFFSSLPFLASFGILFLRVLLFAAYFLAVSHCHVNVSSSRDIRQIDQDVTTAFPYNYV